MIFVILIASINRKRMTLMWLWSIGRDILKPSTSKWVFLEKRHQGGLGSSLLVYSSPAYKSWGSQINSFYLSTIYLIFDLMWCTQLGRMNSDVALIMLDIPVVQCGSVNAEGNFLSLNHVSQTEVAILLILAHTSYLSQISQMRHFKFEHRSFLQFTLFCRDLRFFVWRNLLTKIVYMWRKWQISDISPLHHLLPDT